jgi:hypothetical protein
MATCVRKAVILMTQGMSLKGDGSSREGPEFSPKPSFVLRAEQTLLAITDARTKSGFCAAR